MLVSNLPAIFPYEWGIKKTWMVWVKHALADTHIPEDVIAEYTPSNMTPF